MGFAVLSGSFVSIVEVRADALGPRPGWEDGALPLRLLDGPANAEQSERAGRYLSTRVDAALYKPEIRQWARSGEIMVELLKMTDELALPLEPTHLFVLHRSLTPSWSVEDIHEQIRLATTEGLSEFGIQNQGRSFHLVAIMTSPSTFHDAAFDGNPSHDRAILAWQLATLRSDQPPQSDLARLADTQNLSEPTADMTLLVHHDGCALVLSDGDVDAVGPFHSWLKGEPAEDVAASEVQWHLHTTLTDCILLGLLQRSGLNLLADRLADVATRRPDVEVMLTIEAAFAKFKASVWWRHVSEEETGNLVLRAFQSKHRLDGLFDEVAQGVAQYSGQVQALSAALSSAAVTILTLTLFPLTVLVAFIAAVTPSSANFVIKLVAYFSCVPLSLAIGLAVASRIPHYLPFLRSTLRSRRL